MEIRNAKTSTSILLLTIFSLTIAFNSCINDEDEFYNPKPRGYFRIDLPKHEYQKFDSVYPYSFQYSKHAILMPDNSPEAEPYWINILYPDYNATIYISHKIVKNNLSKYTEDARTFANKHIPKADDLIELEIYDPKSKVYGKIYHIEGSGVASTCQFWVTDSIKHFVRGSLYFNQSPNNDSLAPVIKYLRDDVLKMMNTFEWKN